MIDGKGGGDSDYDGFGYDEADDGKFALNTS